MPQQITLQLTPQQASDKALYIPIAARMARINESQIALARVTKRSIDARNRTPKVNMTIELYIDNEPAPEAVHFDYPNVDNATEVIIVGSGPAGLFCALRLIELGFKPIVLERGKEVSARKVDIATINRNGAVNPDSNYAFGEGGAGTFSDGKLYTRSKKRGDYNRALRVLVFNGANEEILYDAHPHIGTDKLPRIISNIRELIRSCGGKVIFETRVEQIVVRDSRACAVKTASGDVIEGAAVVLATGHSAGDIYQMLQRDGIRIEAKPFAMGIRVEHPQQLIDSIQYSMPERGEYLPAASYSLAAQIAGRGVYSFCMCPGGFIVPAMTDPMQSVVNGMSPSGRNSVFANSGIVTEIRTEDFEHLRAKHGELAGLEFQRMFEQAAKKQGGEGQIAPAARLGDFVQGKRSSSLPKTSYVPGVTPSDMKWMPSFIGKSLRYGLENFGRRMRGFITNEALIVGVESRTSSPVRVPRDSETLAHPEIAALYPCGEGAGYAGGIISAALDGERIAEAIAKM